MRYKISWKLNWAFLEGNVGEEGRGGVNLCTPGHLRSNISKPNYINLVSVANGD